MARRWFSFSTALRVVPLMYFFAGRDSSCLGLGGWTGKLKLKEGLGEGLKRMSALSSKREMCDAIIFLRAAVAFVSNVLYCSLRPNRGRTERRTINALLRLLQLLQHAQDGRRLRLVTAAAAAAHVPVKILDRRADQVARCEHLFLGGRHFARRGICRRV